MRLISVIAGAGLYGVASLPVATATDLVQTAAKTKWPECFCTDRYGKRRELGEIICLTVGDRSYMAKCVMAQNVPFWRDTEQGCLSSSLPQKLSPARSSIIALYQQDFSGH